MYRVSSHSNHLLAKTGRPRTLPISGTSNNIESPAKRSTSANNGSSSASQSDCQELSPDIMTSPKLVFNKKSPAKQNYQNGQSVHLTQNHEDMLRFVQTTWQQVMQEFEVARGQGSDKVVYYDRTVNSNNNEVLTDFKPFDLEEWYFQRIAKA